MRCMNSKPAQHVLVNLSAVEPAPVKASEGWRDMDIRFLIDRARTGSGSVCLFRALFAPGAAHEAHLHPNADEVYFVIRGNPVVGYGSQELAIEPGTAEFVPAGAVHWLRNPAGSEPVEVVGCYLGVGSLAEAGYVPAHKTP